MSEVRTSIEIGAPPEKVWDFVMDPHNFDEWVTIHRRINRADPGPPREGMVVEQTLCLRHTHFKVKWKLQEVQAGRLARWEGRGPMGSHASSCYRLSPADGGGTRFDYVNEFRPPGGALGAAASRVVVGDVPEKEANASLAKLKKVLENGR